MRILTAIKAFFQKRFKRQNKEPVLPIPPMNIVVVDLIGMTDGFKITCEVDTSVRVNRRHDGWHCVTLKGFVLNEGDLRRKFFYTLEEAREYITERLEKNL